MHLIVFSMFLLFLGIMGSIVYWKYYIPSKKFFHECFGDPHRDHRFCSQKTSVTKTDHQILVQLYREFFSLCQHHHIRPVLYAGTLLGWHFNKQMLPWDDDIDLIVLSEDVPKLLVLDGYSDNDLILEINPNANSRVKDLNNIIDARVISRHSGRFLDIVFFYRLQEPHDWVGGKLLPRDSFPLSDVYPLEPSTFHGLPCFVPHKPIEILKRLYSLDAIEPFNHGPPRDKKWRFTESGWEHKK